MNHSEDIKELTTAMVEVQKEVKWAEKGSQNPFYSKSYASLEDVWEACRESLTKNGIAVIQSPDFNENDMWLETTLCHVSGQWMSGRYPIRSSRGDPQSIGSAVTYARRYSVMSMVGIVAKNEDDDGNAASGHDVPPPVRNQQTSTKQNEDAASSTSAPPPPSTTTSAAKDKASVFKEEVIARLLKGFQTLEEFEEWRKQNITKIARLKTYFPGDHTAIMKDLDYWPKRLAPPKEGN